jgi:hypothetical protein
MSREEKLEQLKRRDDIKVTEIKKDILRLEYPSGKVLYKNIADYRPPTTNNKLIYSPTYDSTIIDLTTIDTTLYYKKYRFWQEVPLHNWDFDCLRIGDVNNNGKVELYGSRKFFWNEFEPITIYELNSYDLFDFKFQYDSVLIARNIYDVDKDGQEEVLLTKTPGYGPPGNEQRFFSKENDTSFATQLNFTYIYGTGAQLDDITFGDFDGDAYTDMLFNRWGKPYVFILEYNPVINNFDSVYRFDTQETAPYDEGGFSVGDFDLDGKTDMVFGTGRGNVFVIENEGDNQYINSWQGSVESYNAYIHTWSNDIDKNGKPEFWVLGDAYYNGIGTTRITIFETNGDNNYEVVGRVDLVGVFSFYAGTMQAVDIDNDGIQEIEVCIDQNFLVLKFNGNQNHQTYEVYYIKQNELAAAGENSVYFGATVYDIKNNGDFNLLISMDHIIEQGGQYTSRRFTQIYKPDSLTSMIDNEFLPSRIKLAQNYPNPFNPSTKIKFTIPTPPVSSPLLKERTKEGFVTLKVYDVLGEEIATLVNEESATGGAREYEVEFDGTNLPSGVYFYQLQAGDPSTGSGQGFVDTKKMILLK